MNLIIIKSQKLEMKIRFFYTFITVFMLLSNVIFCQESKLQIKGEQFLKKEKYTEAIIYFSTLDSATRVKEHLYNYYYGMSFYYSPNNKAKAEPYLKAYIESTDTNKINYYGHQHVYFSLGKIYHLTYKFDDAILFYSQYIALILNQPNLQEDEKQILISRAKRNIEQCKFAKIAVNNPRHVIIENLGDSINTIYPEYAAVVSQDEKMIIFTSRRPSTTGGKKIPNEGYMEDMYKAEMSKGSLYETRERMTDSTAGYYFNLVTDFEYEKFENLGSKINSKSHDGSIQLGGKDSLLYFHRDSDIWSIAIFDTTVTEPTKMGTHINSDQHEPSLFFSNDGEQLFIVSDKPGGYGGLDIYVSQKQLNGNWSEAKNLGPNINTKYDEDSPYLDPNGTTIYFSSRGNSSIGESDVFRSTLNDTTWSSPVNLGYPINTPSDDVYFTMTSRYNRGYYSSGRLEGKGDIDLYRITFADERDPIAEMVGFVRKGKSLIPAKSKISMIAIGTNESINHETDSIVGDYFLLLGHGKKYEMTVETEGFAPYRKVIDIPEQKKYFQLYQEVHHVYLYNSNGGIIGQQITVYNAVGENDSITTYYNENTLANFLALKKVLSDEFTVRSLNNMESDSLTLMLSDFGNFNFDKNFELRNLGLYEIDSLLSIIERNMMLNFDEFNKSNDVKFYMTSGSLMQLMKNDTILNFKFDENTSISFLEENGEKNNLDSYKNYVGSLDRNDFIKKPEPPKNYAIAKDVKDISGLFYTVQIGVYANPVAPEVLLNITPLNSQVTDNGFIRYTTGTFYDIPQAVVLKDIMITEKRVVDAYVTAYYNGVRITILKSKSLLEEFGFDILYNSNSNMILNRK